MLRPTASCLLLLLPLAVSAAAGVRSSSCKVMEVVETWQLGFSMNLKLTFPIDVESWSATLEFDTQLANLETWTDQLDTSDNQTYTLSNNMWDGGHHAGEVVTEFFVVDFQSASDRAQLISFQLLGDELC